TSWKKKKRIAEAFRYSKHQVLGCALFTYCLHEQHCLMQPWKELNLDPEDCEPPCRVQSNIKEKASQQLTYILKSSSHPGRAWQTRLRQGPTPSAMLKKTIRLHSRSKPPRSVS
ncbi:mCG144549, partial [Mus musculus]